MFYDYKCNECGVFEVQQSIKDAPLEVCPKCGSKVQRVIGKVGVVYKCGGFYSKPIANLNE